MLGFKVAEPTVRGLLGLVLSGGFQILVMAGTPLNYAGLSSLRYLVHNWDSTGYGFYFHQVAQKGSMPLTNHSYCNPRRPIRL